MRGVDSTGGTHILGNPEEKTTHKRKYYIYSHNKVKCELFGLRDSGDTATHSHHHHR